MDKKISRRVMLGAAPAALAGAAAFAAAHPAASPAVPWPWIQTDPASVQERAYQSATAKTACMYGTFEAVIGTLADKHGAPYDSFPVLATLYGSGGVAGLGSLCGALNASGMLFGLFAKNQDAVFAMCRELFAWYEKAALPAYRPKSPKLDIPIVQTVANSTLCQVSTSTWLKASGNKLRTPEMFERCNRLVADVAAQAVALLNKYTV
jgi:hypothetical protein